MGTGTARISHSAPHCARRTTHSTAHHAQHHRTTHVAPTHRTAHHARRTAPRTSHDAPRTPPGRRSRPGGYNTPVTRKLCLALSILVATAAVAIHAHAQKPAGPSVDVFKSPTCGCCAKWVDHMRNAGFIVHVTDLGDAELQKIKARYGVPASAQSCHTARVE